VEYTLQWLFEWWSWWLTNGFRGTLLLDAPVSVCLCFSCVHFVFFLCGAVLISFSLSQAHCGSETCFCSVNGNAERFALQGKIMEVRSHLFQRENPAKTCKNHRESGGSTFHATYTERAYFLKNTFKVFHSRANVLCDETKKDCWLLPSALFG